MNVAQMRERLAAIEGELSSLHDAAGEERFSEDQQTTWDTLMTERASLQGSIERHEQRERFVRDRAARPGSTVPGDGARGADTPADPMEVLGSLRYGADPRETRNRLTTSILRSVDGRIEGGERQRTFETILHRHAGDTAWAAQILARSTPAYASAFAKLVTGRAVFMTDDEKRAAMAVGTNTAGGYLVPTHLDPTLIITNSGTSNVIRGISRVVTLTGGANEWNGVTTAGATASWDAELTEVSDDTPAIGPVNIPVHSARALVQASFEAFEDIPGLASDVSMLLADARDRLEGAAHAVGTGSNQPTGVFTALDANTNVEITSTTAATIGLVDLNSLYRGVPVRWRSRSRWLMNPLYNLAVKGLGTALGASYTTDLTQAPSGVLLGRPVTESDDAPATQTTTALDLEIIFGDFSNFVIVDKPGSAAIEFIPNMFNTSNNLPDGRRAWFMHWRNGSDSVNDLAFRLLLDKTSA